MLDAAAPDAGAPSEVAPDAAVDAQAPEQSAPDGGATGAEPDLVAPVAPAADVVDGAGVDEAAVDGVQAEGAEPAAGQPEPATAEPAPTPPADSAVGPPPAGPADSSTAAPRSTATAPPEAGAAPARAEPRDSSAGPTLYFRLAMGVGFPFGPDIADRYDELDLDEEHDLRFSGTSFAMDLMAGAALRPWLVLGGGFVSDQIATGEVQARAGSGEEIERSLYFAVLGAYVDLYTAPPAGFHVQALLGLARLSPSTDLGENTAVGLGAVLGVGYEWRASERWNLGILGRIALAPMGMDDVDGQELSPTLFEPSLLITATYRAPIGIRRAQ